MNRISIAVFVVIVMAVSVEAQMHQRFPAASDVTLSTQSTSLSTTNIIGAAPAGIYNVCWVQQITQAASVSSSLVTTIGWNNGAAKTTTLYSLNGGALGLVADVSNTLNSTGGSCIMIYSIASQSITYSTTYTSTGGTSMQYSLYITAERYQ